MIIALIFKFYYIIGHPQKIYIKLIMTKKTGKFLIIISGDGDED